MNKELTILQSLPSCRKYLYQLWAATTCGGRHQYNNCGGLRSWLDIKPFGEDEHTFGEDDKYNKVWVTSGIGLSFVILVISEVETKTKVSFRV